MGTVYRATKDDGDLLEEAHALLEHLVHHAPAAWRQSMRTKVHLHREIAQAREASGQASSNASRNRSP